MKKTFIVVGCGSMGRRRIRHALGLSDAVVGVYDIRDDRMAEVEGLFDVTRLGGIDRFAEFSPDGLFVCVPPADHEVYLDWAIENGVPFMVEQPITHRLDNLDAIIERVREKALVTHVSANHRHSAETTAFKAVIQAGDLGKPLAVMAERGEWLPDWHPYEPYTDYYPSSRVAGGGLDAICDIDWLRYLFGDVTEAKSLCAKQSGLDIDTYDLTQFLFSFSSGVQASLHIDMLQRTYGASTKIVFERGTLMHRIPALHFSLFRLDTGEWQDIAIKEERERFQSMQGKGDFNFVEPMYERDTRAFLDHLARDDANTDSIEQGIANLRVVHPLVDGI